MGTRVADVGLIVVDANVYVDAISYDGVEVLGDPPSLKRIPSLPPRRVHPALHVIGVVRDGSDTGDGPALAVSDHILLMVVHALRQQGLDHKIIRQYAYAIRDLAVQSSGGYHERVPGTQTDCPDPEDNKILELAVLVDADAIVTNDSDLLHLGRPAGWQGQPSSRQSASQAAPTALPEAVANKCQPSYPAHVASVGSRYWRVAREFHNMR
jgi:hypothetical protein